MGVQLGVLYEALKVVETREDGDERGRGKTHRQRPSVTARRVGMSTGIPGRTERSNIKFQISTQN